MNILFVCDSRNRRSVQILYALKSIRNKFKIKIYVYVINNDPILENKHLHIFKNLDGIKKENSKFDLIIFSSWAGEETQIDEISAACNASLVVDFQDCAEGLEYLCDNETRKKRQNSLMEMASGMLVRDPRWMDYPAPRKILKTKNFILFRDYFLNKKCKIPFGFSCDLGKVCFIGSFGRGDLEPELGYTKIFDELLRQNIKIVFIPKKDHSDYSDNCPYWKLAKKDKNFVFHKTVKMQNLKAIINNCGIGLNLIQGDLYQDKLKKVTPEYLKGCSSSRLCDYTESGVGVGITASLKYMKEIWAPSGACLVLDTEKLGNLKYHLAEVRHNFDLKTYKTWYKNNLLENNLSSFQALIQKITGKELIQKSYLKRVFFTGLN